MTDELLKYLDVVEPEDEEFKQIHKRIRCIVERSDPTNDFLTEQAKILVGKLHYVPDLFKRGNYYVKILIAKDFILNLLKEK